MLEKYITVNENGCTIRCKLYCEKPREAESLILYCTGFAGHKDNASAKRIAERLMTKNKAAALLTFDWPCHGQDVKKKLRLEDCDRYLETLIAYCEKQLGVKHLFAYAVSFGGYLILKYLSEHGNPFEKAVLRCPAIDMYRTLNARLIGEKERELLAKGKEVQAGFDRKIPVDPALLEGLRAADVTERDFLEYAEELLIVQGTKDEIVTSDTNRVFADRNCIRFVSVEGADHRFQDPLKAETALREALSFMGFRC